MKKIRLTIPIIDPTTQIEYSVTLCASIGDVGRIPSEHELGITEILIETDVPEVVESIVLSKIKTKDYDAEIWEKYVDLELDYQERE